MATYDDLTTFFDHADWQATERVRSNVHGVSALTCTGLPYGDDQSCVGPLDPTPTQFTGKIRDPETGLDYFGARFYASNSGRFMLPDWSAVPAPIPYADMSNPQTLNLYTYVGNNPINGIDADGHQTLGMNGQECGIVGVAPNTFGQTLGVPGQVPCSTPGPPIVSGPYSADNGVGQQLASDTAQASIQKLGSQQQQSQGQQSGGANPYYKPPAFDAALWNVSDFSAGAGNFLSFGLTNKINKMDGAFSSIDQNSSAYHWGTGTGVGLGLVDMLAGGFTAGAVADGKTGALFGRGGAIHGGFLNRGFVRFGWYWNGVRDAIGLRIGPAGTFHLPFWYP